MPWETCSINFNRGSTDCFFAGDIVTGTVIVKFKHTSKIEHFELDINGISKASWTRPMPTIPYIKLYSESRKLLTIHSDIFTELQGGTILPGIYIHHFHFALPRNSPPTFKSSIAKVFYFIKVQCHASNGLKKKMSISFDVSITLDINHLEKYLMPTIIQMHKKFWDSGKLTMQIQTFTGFAPNQTISFEAIICNSKKVKISKLSVTLVQLIEYNVSSGYLIKEKKIKQVNYTTFSQIKSNQIIFIQIRLLQALMKVRKEATTGSEKKPQLRRAGKKLREVELVFPYRLTLFKRLPVTISTVPVMHV